VILGFLAFKTVKITEGLKDGHGLAFQPDLAPAQRLHIHYFQAFYAGFEIFAF